MLRALLVVAVVVVGALLSFFGFVFCVAFYPVWTSRRRTPASAVIVLGSGLIDGAVTPLLASRLRRGRQVYQRLVSRGGAPVLVTSGGRGDDEPVAEARAMADYLIAEGFTGPLLIEDASRSTEENLVNTRELLAERGISGPVVAVSSDYHALRAALLLRRLGMPGYAVGAPTKPSYWPGAVVREFFAVLRDHLLVVTLLTVAAAAAVLAVVP